MPDVYKLLINGQWMESESGERFPVTNPANGETVAKVAQGGITDAQAALQAAHDAFPQWAGLPARERAELMHRAAAIFRERLDDVAPLLTREQGKPLSDSLKELRFSAKVIDYYAEEGHRLTGTHFEGDGGATYSFVLKQPVGVKPPSEAPLAAGEFVRCFVDAGLPPGVVNIVAGPGHTVGAELVQNPLSRKIAFTGSTKTGLWIAQEAAKHLKRVTLELGGSAPFVVCRDADLDIAVPEALRRSFSHTGQICISVNRIFVQESVADEFTERFVEQARALRVADGLAAPDADMGPMISESGRQTVREHVADAVEKGATVLTGGREPEGAEYERGYFYLPTVLANVTRDMRVMCEETFGPVAPIAIFRDLDEGLAMANDTPYGLAAYVYTQDLDTAMYAAARLEAGGVGINVNDITDIRGPFGGRKASGMGRELGQPGLDSYLEVKHVRVRLRRPRG
jgi:succinate-semialdehyde dehydrogenase/glutarate-semialdehyde dehydrogenase